MGHYDEFYEAAAERKNREERARRCKQVVTVEQETEYLLTNNRLYGTPKLVGFVPTSPTERAW